MSKSKNDNIRHGPWSKATTAGNEVVGTENTDYDEPMTSQSKDDVDAKIEAVEARMETRLVKIESMISTNFAELKSDLHKSNADTVKWVAGIVATTMALAITVMTFVINNASPKQQPSNQPQVVFTVPATAAAPQGTSSSPPMSNPTAPQTSSSPKE